MPTAKFSLWLFQSLVLTGMLAAWVWALARWGGGGRLLEARPAPLARWGQGTVLTVILAYLAVQIIVVGLVLTSTRPSPSNPQVPQANKPAQDAGETPGPRKTAPADSSMTSRMFAITIINLVVIVLVPPLVGRLSGATAAELGLTLPRGLRDIWTGVVAFFLVTPWVFLIFGLAQLVYKGTKHPLETMLRQEAGSGTALLAILSGVIMAPIAEEILFRGVIQTWLNRLFLGGPRSLPGLTEPVALFQTESARVLNQDVSVEPLLPSRFGLREDALDSAAVSTGCQGGGADSTTGREMIPVALTSVMFAAVHYSEMPAPVAIFFLSLALGFLYQRTGNLVASITLHALFNGLSTFQLLLSLS